MSISRRSVIQVGLAGLLVAPAAFSVKRSEPAFTVKRSDPNSAFEDWRRNFEAGIQARMDAAHVVGASVAITSPQNAVRYAASFGYADLAAKRKLTVNTPIHLASVSKLFTATALVQLFERCGYDLDRNINNYLDFSVVNPQFPNLPITARQLLTHTSSISDNAYPDRLIAPGDPTIDMRTFLKDYLTPGGKYYGRKTSFSTAKPGAKWDYSNVGMSLVGYILQYLSGRKFDTYIQQNVLGPLGIQDAHWYIREFAPNVLAVPYKFKNGHFVALPQEGYPEAASGLLRCSVTDLATSLQAMIGQERDPSTTILSSGAVAEMLRSQVPKAVQAYQGLGWVQEETATIKVVGHSGADDGASNLVALTPDNKQAVAILMNIDGTDKTDVFRYSVADDLLAGAKLVR